MEQRKAGRKENMVVVRVWGRVGYSGEGWWSEETLRVDWQFVRRQVLQRSLLRWAKDELNEFGFPWLSSPPLPLSHCHSNHHGGLSFLHSWPHYFLFLHLSLILPLPPLTHIDWHEPISKTLISAKPQGTHCLQLFSCLTQSCHAVRTHNDTEEWNPWRYLNIINISWRWIWAPLLNSPLIAT